MPVHRDFRASIIVDGKPLTEYGGAVDTGDRRVYNCWIASEVGKVCRYEICLVRSLCPDCVLRLSR